MNEHTLLTAYLHGSIEVSDFIEKFKTYDDNIDDPNSNTFWKLRFFIGFILLLDRNK